MLESPGAQFASGSHLHSQPWQCHPILWLETASASLPRRRCQDGIGCVRALQVVKHKRSRSRLRDHDDTCEKRGGRKEVWVRRVSNSLTVCWKFDQIDGKFLEPSFPLELFRDLQEWVCSSTLPCSAAPGAAQGHRGFCVNMVVDLEGLSVN